MDNSGKRAGLKSKALTEEPLSKTEHWSPVRKIKPPRHKEPAELCTIATILLRRNKTLFEGKYDEQAAKCINLLSISETRQLTGKEAKQAVACIAVLKEAK